MIRDARSVAAASPVSIKCRCAFCSPTTTGSRPPACRRCAARCSAVAGVELAVIAPDGNRSAMARSITTRRPLWVQEVDFGDGTVGYATDGTPGRLRAAGPPGPDRGLRGRAGRLGDQPRLQPRRRHHLLGHGRGGARGDRPRPARDRRLAAVARAASSTSARGRRSTSRPRRRSRRGSWPSSRTCRCPPGTLLNINVPGARPRGRRGGAAGQARLPRRAVARRRGPATAAGCTGSTATPASSATRPAPTWRRSRRARSR